MRKRFVDKKALLLDMNSTFMFGEDRFGDDEDYSIYYRSIGGAVSSQEVNRLITLTYEYLAERYPDERFRHAFPSVRHVLTQVSNDDLSDYEIDLVINTFAFHEHGYIPEEYINVLFNLREQFILSAVIDIWAPKRLWIDTFKRHNIYSLFSAFSFSSDHGMVKPSPEPFRRVVEQLNLPINQCVVIGDSVRRDLGGATAAGIECILVGVGKSEQAIAHYPTLIDFYNDL